MRGREDVVERFRYGDLKEAVCDCGGRGQIQSGEE